MLKAQGVGYWYVSGNWLFRDVDLSVKPGECVAILGPNARGKTTLLTCLAGVRTPREGMVQASGSVGYVPQNNDSNLGFTAFDMVLMGTARNRSPWSSPSKEDEDKAQRALKRVGLLEHAHKIFSGMSGGQRQLVLIARALASDPLFLILDEPTSALDMRNQSRTLCIMRQLCNEGIGVVFTTHDPTHALHVADRTLLMDKTISCGDTLYQLTESKLSDLYQISIKTPDVSFADSVRRIVVPDYSDGERL